MIEKKSLENFNDATKLTSGVIIRLYGVDRFDIMKTADDRSNPLKVEKDYYDLLICDVNDREFLYLINITQGSGKSGLLFAKLKKTNVLNKPNTFFNYVTIAAIKEFFMNETVYILNTSLA